MHRIKGILSKYIVLQERSLESDTMCNINSSLGFKYIFVLFSCLILEEHINGDVICRHSYLENILLKMLIDNAFQYFIFSKQKSFMN